MKKKALGFLGVALGASLFLASCGSNENQNINENGFNQNFNPFNNQVTTSISDSEKGSSDIEMIDEDVNDSAFTITTVDGGYTVSDNVYTITKGGTYSLSGKLTGMIYVCVTEASTDSSYDVILELDGATIINSENSPIYIKESTDSSISYEVEISAKKDTQNVIKDTRELKTEDSNLGSAAIYSEVDLKLKGKGELYVSSSYNNGIHSKDDIKIKNLTLAVSAPNNAIKGNDSVTIESGTLSVISTGGDGIKTTNTSLSSKGSQKGTVTITGGSVSIYSCQDGIDAAYDVVISDLADVSIYTDTYSSYTSTVFESTTLTALTSSVSEFGGGPGGPGGGNPGGGGFNPGGEGNTDKSSHSAKGIKADNEILVSGGTINIKAYDDGLHANNETTIESTNASGVGSITVSGGNLTIYASDDGLHADNTINITDSAYINITNSHEGIEANQIVFTGGVTYVYATDDAVNAAKCGMSTTPAVYIKDGYIDLDCASGDTDTLDSNGSVYISGGYTVLKNRGNSSSSMTGGTIDIDNQVTLTGGILLSFGTWCTEANVSATKTSTSQLSAGTYTLVDSDGNEVLTTILAQSYQGYRLFNKTSNSYTLYKDSTTIATL